MKSKFVFSQTAWDRFKFFVRGPSSIVYQSMAEAIAYRDAAQDPELKKLLSAYVNGCETAVGFRGHAKRDEELFQKLIRGEENLHSGLSFWAKKQIDILKADNKGQNAQSFETLNKISDRALITKRPTRNPFAPSDAQNTSNSGSAKTDSKQNSENNNNKKYNITTKSSNPKAPVSDSKQDSGNNVNINDTPIKPNSSKPSIYNNKINNSTLSESLKSEDFNDVSKNSTGFGVEEPKKPADYSDYFNKIKTGNDFLFLAASKVFPEIQTYGKDPTQKSKIESYWKIENKEKIKSKLEEIAENPWIVRNYPHIPVLLPEAITKLDKKMRSV
jgi:hypothetical protein